jgi:hypothetical protein
MPLPFYTTLKFLTMQNLKQTLLTLLLISALFAACDKDEDTPDPNIKTSKVTMSAANEIQTPAVVSPATGNVDVTYNKVSKKLDYTITWNNLTSDSIRGSHIHGVASKTQNAPVRHGFNMNILKSSGTYSGTTQVDGVVIKEDSLLLGFYYFNIHTKMYPGGEIRGQIEFK